MQLKWLVGCPSFPKFPKEDATQTVLAPQGTGSATQAKPIIRGLEIFDFLLVYGGGRKFVQK
ncbi:hypothetical protein [Nostoc sp.]|uniref:hypothetical protein n=1 Tax=Nostoc sp. TaxID=1180 RepID=UPI003593703C